ncbi:MAG TPA: helix-turn-helix domain-containing protein [Thermoanaerobaculia bacterium]|nr:helix-turn-helix domain-containing protein [Thermoanaerobaculia bacterium]
MTNTAKNPYPFAESVGATVRERRQAQGLSEVKLARKADVSRRHLAELQKGANVTLLVLLKAMTALDLDEVDLRPGKTVSATIAPRVLPDLLGEAAAGLEGIATNVLRIAATFRAAVKGGKGGYDSAKVSDALAAKAARLIDEFSDFVRNLDDLSQVDALQNLIDVSLDDVPLGRYRSARKPKKSA